MHKVKASFSCSFIYFNLHELDCLSSFLSTVCLLLNLYNNVSMYLSVNLSIYSSIVVFADAKSELSCRRSTFGLKRLRSDTQSLEIFITIENASGIHSIIHGLEAEETAFWDIMIDSFKPSINLLSCSPFKQGRKHGTPVADGWAGAAKQKTAHIM